jgi:hypothetical protein
VNGLVGDVHRDVQHVAAFVSPIPGGVGPLTRAMLLTNVVEEAERQVTQGHVAAGERPFVAAARQSPEGAAGSTARSREAGPESDARKSARPFDPGPRSHHRRITRSASSGAG